MLVGDTGGLGIIESQIKLKNIFSADVYATAAVGALTGQDYWSCTSWYFFQGWFYDLVFRTNNEAVHAIVAIFTMGC